MEPIKKDKKCKRKLEKNFKEEEELSDEDANEDMMEEEIDYSSKKKPMEGDEDWDDDEEITVDFEFYDPNPNQFFSIKSLINGYLDGLSYKSSDLAQIIIDQVQVGTMIGTLDEEEAEALNKNKQFDKNILGFASILSFSQNKKQKVFQEIIKYIEDKSKIHNANHDNFLKILNNHNIGLFINERFLL